MTRSQVIACGAVLVACLSLGRASRARQPEPESYGCVFLVDGLRGDLARKYADEGLMPTIKRELLDRGLWVDHATSTYPTITGACIPTLVTGAYPGRHNIPSLYFFDREQRKYHVLYTIKGSFRFNQLLDTQRTRTIFEWFPEKDDTWSVGLQVYRGADAMLPVALTAGYKPMEYAAKLKEFFRGLKRMVTGRRKARLAVIYNGWFDHKEHTFGPDADEMREHYRAVDAQFAEIIEMYRKLGIYEKTYFVLCSDHGQLAYDKWVNLWDFVRENSRIAMVANDWVTIPGVGSTLPLEVRNPERWDEQAMVLPAGDAHALLYFQTPQRVKGTEARVERAADIGGWADRDLPTAAVELDGWDRHPAFNDLRHYPMDGREVDVVEVARNHEAIDFCVGKNREDGCIYVFGKGRREARIERRPAASGFEYRYTVADGDEDPLDYLQHADAAELVNRDPDAAGGFHSDRRWQLATLESEYPDAPVQLTQAFDSDRSPDLFLNGAKGYCLIGSTYAGEHSRHGALNRFESWTTMAFAGPGLAAGRAPTARSVDVTPTLLHLMNVPYDPSFMDGAVLPEALRGARRLAPRQ